MSNPGNSGFTLVEMLIVLALTGLIALGVGIYSRTSDELLGPFVKELNSFLETQRYLALGKARAQNIRVNIEQRSIFSSSGYQLVVPDTIELVLQSSAVRNGQPIILFLPDGEILGGSFVITQGSKEIRVPVP